MGVSTEEAQAKLSLDTSSLNTSKREIADWSSQTEKAFHHAAKPAREFHKIMERISEISPEAGMALKLAFSPLGGVFALAAAGIAGIVHQIERSREAIKSFVEVSGKPFGGGFSKTDSDRIVDKGFHDLNESMGYGGSKNFAPPDAEISGATEAERNAERRDAIARRRRQLENQRSSLTTLYINNSMKSKEDIIAAGTVPRVKANVKGLETQKSALEKELEAAKLQAFTNVEGGGYFHDVGNTMLGYGKAALNQVNTLLGLGGDLYGKHSSGPGLLYPLERSDFTGGKGDEGEAGKKVAELKDKIEKLTHAIEEGTRRAELLPEAAKESAALVKRQNEELEALNKELDKMPLVTNAPDVRRDAVTGTLLDDNGRPVLDPTTGGIPLNTVKTRNPNIDPRTGGFKYRPLVPEKVPEAHPAKPAMETVAQMMAKLVEAGTKNGLIVVGKDDAR